MQRQSNKRRFTPDPEAAKRKRAEALSRLEQEIDRIQSSDEFRRFLQVSARFHRYSLNNQLLIASQFPTATRVAGYKAWQEMGRHVKQGEKGIQIVVPRVVGAKRQRVEADGLSADADEPGAQVYFSTGHVFDISQTDGDPLPEVEYRHTAGESAPELWAMCEALAAAKQCRLSSDERATTANGFFQPSSRTIWYKPELTLDGRVSTVLHELAHVYDHDANEDVRREYRAHRADREIVAESAAYVAALAFGLDTFDESATYAATWAHDREHFNARLSDIHAVSAALIDGLRTVSHALAAA